ncbi:MAG: EcsC family protein [Mediterraneibacter sp.]
MDIKNVKDVIKKTADEVGKTVADTSRKTKDNLSKTAVFIKEKSSSEINKVIDVNGDGQIDIEDVIIMSLKIPGICINRDEFLHSEFMKDFTKEVIEDAIEHNPAHAGITTEQIEKYADEVIKFERNCVTGISAALSAPGGFAMAATIPADIAQYYGYMLRVTQKLLYLYGFPQIDVTEKGRKFDTETLNILTLCLGVMYGVAGANNALKAVAKALGTGVQKQLMKKALTKGTVYPIVKSVAKWFGVKMTKEVFTGFFKHAIPVVGGVIGGGLTYMSFKPCCEKLKQSLKDTVLSNPNRRESEFVIDVTEEIENLNEREEG